MTEAYIFTEGSKTTAEDRDLPLSEYYEGLFNIVLNLYEELDEVSEAHLRVLSEEYGVGDGDEPMSSVMTGKETPVGFDGMVEEATEEMLDAASRGDVVVILLSTEVFDATVEESWAEIVDAAKTDSVWCLGAAKGSLDSLDIEALEKKVSKVLTYRRKGVARIGKDTREDLLEIARKK
jgi:hypothetical protein